MSAEEPIAEENDSEAEDSEEQSSTPLITEDELREQYEDEGKTFTQIGEELDVTPSTISYYAKKYGIQATTSQSYEGTEVDDPDWLREKYHDEGLSMQEVGDLVGCSDGTVMRYMRKHDIEPRAARQGGSSEPGPFHIVESVKGVGPAKIGALEERGLENDEDVNELLDEVGVVSDAGDEDATGLAETHGWSEDLAEAVSDQLQAGEPASDESDDDEESEE